MRKIFIFFLLVSLVSICYSEADWKLLKTNDRSLSPEDYTFQIAPTYSKLAWYGYGKDSEGYIQCVINDSTTLTYVFHFPSFKLMYGWGKSFESEGAKILSSEPFKWRNNLETGDIVEMDYRHPYENYRLTVVGLMVWYKEKEKTTSQPHNSNNLRR